MIFSLTYFEELIMKNSLIALATAAILSATMASPALAQQKDYADLKSAARYNLALAPGSNFEPEFVVGSQYTWEELMLVLIDYNIQRGHTERANYLSIALKDKQYYFFGG